MGKLSEQRIDQALLREWCMNKLTEAGVPGQDAAVTADVLVHANLRGVDSHGVLRMEHYVRKIGQGGINPRPNPKVTGTGPATAIVDGDDGLGHVVAKAAMAHAIELARSAGVGVVSAINSSHCGALSYFVEMAASEGFIGIAMTNTDKMVAPFGGSAPYFGTNPMAYGIPSGDGSPVILDMATSSVAYGKILEAVQGGREIPPDWAVDSQGRPITDPGEFGALLPFGGAKGYGLSMMVDIFAGLLTGSPFGPYIGAMYGEDLSRRRKLGHFFCVIDIGRFTDREQFNRNMARMSEDLRAMKPAPGFGRVMLPGEPESERAKSRLNEGIPLSDALISYLSSSETVSL